MTYQPYTDEEIAEDIRTGSPTLFEKGWLEAFPDHQVYLHWEGVEREDDYGYATASEVVKHIEELAQSRGEPEEDIWAIAYVVDRRFAEWEQTRDEEE